MAAQKPVQRSTAARKEAAKANIDINWEIAGETVTFDGPSQLPGTFMFDIAALEATSIGEESPFGTIYRLIESVIGTEQMPVVRDALATCGSADGGTTELADLLSTIVTAYGADEGE